MKSLRLTAEPKKGDEVILGRYPQSFVEPPSPDGLRHFWPASECPFKDPLIWLVLEVDDTRHAALLLSKYVIDAQPYDDDEAVSSWEVCSLRAWLNGEFMNIAFTASEKDCILTTHLENPDNELTGAPGGRATNDKVFLLSLADVWHKDPHVPNSGKYFKSDARFPNDERKAFATPYANDLDMDVNPQWWLRSPGGGEIVENGLCSDAVGIEGDGVVDLDGYYVISENTGVRPAMWVRYSVDAATPDASSGAGDDGYARYWTPILLSGGK